MVTLVKSGRRRSHRSGRGTLGADGPHDGGVSRRQARRGRPRRPGSAGIRAPAPLDGPHPTPEARRCGGDLPGIECIRHDLVRRELGAQVRGELTSAAARLRAASGSISWARSSSWRSTSRRRCVARCSRRCVARSGNASGPCMRWWNSGSRSCRKTAQDRAKATPSLTTRPQSAPRARRRPRRAPPTLSPSVRCLAGPLLRGSPKSPLPARRRGISIRLPLRLPQAASRLHRGPVRWPHPARQDPLGPPATPRSPAAAYHGHRLPLSAGTLDRRSRSDVLSLRPQAVICCSHVD